MKKLLSLATIILISIPLVGCSFTSTEEEAMSKATENRYQELEIREYKGVQLDPAVGPRDNSIKGIQYVDITDYDLKIKGLVNEKITYQYEDILNMESYEKLVTLYCVEGWDATVLWKGALLTDIIGLENIKKEGNTVIFHCVDGYTTSMPLDEIVSKNMILAYSSNGVELPPNMGYPFIVVAEDKLGYKWARWVEAIEISNDPEYEGFWEERGYDNEADVPESRKS